MTQTLCSFLHVNVPSAASHLLEWEKIPYAAWQGAMGELCKSIVQHLSLALNGKPLTLDSSGFKN